MNRPIALLTDFGLKDQYVGSIKGVILSVHPKAVVVDITHEIRPQEIREAAFVLAGVYGYMPKGTIFMTVVDPGVGSAQRALCVKTSHGYLIGPDNGLFTLVLAREKRYEVRAIENKRYFRKPVSATFHGRDIFSPVAAHLSRRDIFRSLGPRVSHVTKFPVLEPVTRHHELRGSIIYLDRFGNAITNLARLAVRAKTGRKEWTIQVTGKYKADLKTYFAQGRPGQLIALWSSLGFLELAVRNASTEKKYGLKIGDSVVVKARV